MQDGSAETEENGREAEIAEAVRSIPRHHFAAPKFQRQAYRSPDRSLSEWQGIPPDRVTIQMVRALDVGPDARVLEFGTGLGFTAAVLGKIVDRVDSVGRSDDRVADARARLQFLGLDNVELLRSSDYKTELSDQEFDAILISEVDPNPPRSLVEMLRPGGNIVVLGEREGTDLGVVRVTRRGDGTVGKEVLGTVRASFLLGDILVDIDSASYEQVEEAAERAGAEGHPIGQVLFESGAITESELTRAVALQHGLTRGDLEELKRRAEPSIAREVPVDRLQYRQAVPIRRSAGRVKVATVDPEPAHDELRRDFGAQKVEVELVSPSEFRELWGHLDLGDLELWESADPANYDDAGRVHPWIDVYNSRLRSRLERTLREAVENGATDVHFERDPEGARVRFRVDGALRSVQSRGLTGPKFERLCDVLRVQAGIASTPADRPATGAFRRRIDGEWFEFEVTAYPTHSGEEFVVRVPLRESEVREIDELGMSDWQTDRFRRHLEEPSGLLLIAGPEGSGTTTSLYAALRWLARQHDRKVVTVEDPVECRIDQVSQTRAGDAGRSLETTVEMLAGRSSDAVGVGDLATASTAREAVRASRAGHLVVASLTASDAVDAIHRVAGSGADPGLVANELVGAFAQRLARRTCPDCRESVDPEPEVLERVFPDGPPDDMIFEAGAGCEACRDTGTRGRIGLFEYVPVESDIREALGDRSSLPELQGRAMKAGATTFRESALERVRDGTVALAELPRVLNERILSSDRVRGGAGG